jgi:hypothetical protein
LTRVNRDLRHEAAEGLFYTYCRVYANTGNTFEAASLLYALGELPGVHGSAGI